MIKDWEAWNEEPLQDQSVDLPDPKDVNLSSLQMDWTLGNPGYLTDFYPEEFDEWMLDITRHLDSVGLKALISQTIPRPTHLNDASKRWSILSKQVAIWMAAHVDDSLLKDIRAHDKIIYADSFVRRAKDCCAPSEV
ncbi:hypothetical protein N7486_000292 [Penicillium sp. IBT 16267x]|nr:hypothetical protein N7486_000292 [Penicillium sp. IBT 16267x]